MEYSFNSFFPISTMHMSAKILGVISHLTSDNLMWIASNREYGEKERYRVKPEVDESLKETEITKEERECIEKVFLSDNIFNNVDDYIKLYQKRMIQLNNAYECFAGTEIEKEKAISFWRSVTDISNIDNAHAMYLSSNNWEFSVFDQVLEELLRILQGDYNRLNPLLTAGIKDVRSVIFTMDMQQYLGLMEEDFYFRIIENGDFIRSNGVCPFFCYIINKRPSLPKESDNMNYESALNEVLSTLKKDKEYFIDVYKCYCKLYYTRMAYDTYEYFGYYSFLRHYAIFITYNMLKNENIEHANMFRHYISTYQFERAISILEKG